MFPLLVIPNLKIQTIIFKETQIKTFTAFGSLRKEQSIFNKLLIKRVKLQAETRVV